MNSIDQARLRRLRRICRDLEIDELAGAVILDLLDELETLRRDLERLRSSVEIREMHF